MTGATGPDDDVAGGRHDEPGGWDAALARLEDVLLSMPFDRALPALQELLERDEVPLSLLLHDERALKLIHEAVLARPLSSREEVTATRGQIELMALEVEVLTDRLRDPEASPADVAVARERLDRIEKELLRLRDML